MPNIGEVWQTTGPDGVATVGVIVDYYPAEESIVLLGRTGRTGRMPVRSLRLVWRRLRDPDLSHVCGQQGCREMAFLHYGSDWRCHRHLRTQGGQPVPACVSGEDTVPETVPMPPGQEVREDVPHELFLQACPFCGDTHVGGGQPCPTCGCRWRAVHPDVHPDVLADVVSRLLRDMRRRGLPPDGIRVSPRHMQAVTDNSGLARNAIVTRGSPGGESPTLCGLPVQPGDGDTILLAKPPLDRCFVVVPLGLLAIRAHGNYRLFGEGGPVDVANVRPWTEAVPMEGSHWRDRRVAGSALTVVGSTIESSGRIVVRFETGEPKPLADVLEHCIRFDRSDAPRIGSRWSNRGTGRTVLVVGVEMQGDLPVVLCREMTNAGLGTVTQRQHLHDLWRNHESITDGAPVIPASEGDEYEMPDGETVTVTQVDRTLGFLVVQVGKAERFVFEDFIAGLPKVERRNVWDRLDDE